MGWGPKNRSLGNYQKFTALFKTLFKKNLFKNKCLKKFGNSIIGLFIVHVRAADGHDSLEPQLFALQFLKHFHSRGNCCLENILHHFMRCGYRDKFLNLFERKRRDAKYFIQ